MSVPVRRSAVSPRTDTCSQFRTCAARATVDGPLATVEGAESKNSAVTISLAGQGDPG